jgi:hypothetical protein
VRLYSATLALAKGANVYPRKSNHQRFVSATAHDVPYPGRVCTHFDNETRPIQRLKRFRNVLRCRPQLSFRQRFSLQTKTAVMAPLVSPIHSYCQTVEIGPKLTEAHLADALLRRCLLPPFSDPAFPSAFPPVPPALPSYLAASRPASSPASMSVHSSFENCYASPRSISLSTVIAP